MPIKLETFVDLKRFIALAEKAEYNVMLTQNSYCVNGKSIMGIMALDLTNVIMLNCNYKDAELFKEFMVKE